MFKIFKKQPSILLQKCLETAETKISSSRTCNAQLDGIVRYVVELRKKSNVLTFQLVLKVSGIKGNDTNPWTFEYSKFPAFSFSNLPAFQWLNPLKIHYSRDFVVWRFPDTFDYGKCPESQENSTTIYITSPSSNKSKYIFWTRCKMFLWGI